MTNTPGDDQGASGEPSGRADQPGEQERPGHWEQQAQQPQPYQPYPQEYPPQAPTQYAPDHPRATTVLVLGILSIVLCSVLGPFAWAMGKKTVEEIDASGGTLGGRGAANAGYVLGIVATILLALGLLAVVVLVALGLIGAVTTSSFN